MTREEEIESWLRHIRDNLRECRWQVVGELYACKNLLISRDIINRIEDILEKKPEIQEEVTAA